MSIKTITTDDLRRMNGKEGLVLQGCGGDPQEWLDGINRQAVQVFPVSPIVICYSLIAFRSLFFTLRIG